MTSRENNPGGPAWWKNPAGAWRRPLRSPGPAPRALAAPCELGNCWSGAVRFRFLVLLGAVADPRLCFAVVVDAGLTANALLGTVSQLAPLN